MATFLVIIVSYIILVNDLVVAGQAIYSYHTTGKSWSAAQSACEVWGGNLATIQDEVENTLILNEIKNRGWTLTWLGATDQAEEGVWRSATGVLLSYTRWQSGGPDGKRGENCAVMDPSNSRWWDLPCGQSRPYICKKVVTAIYMYYTRKKSWSAAQSACEVWGGNLATIQDEVENTLILNEIKNRGMGTIWLGATDEAQEGVWRTPTGEMLPFTMWYPGQPDGGRGQNCGFMSSGTGKWLDTACGWSYHYVCKKYPAVHGKWGAWTPWGSCVAQCGEGKQHRSRTCDNPAPQYGGNVCQGNTNEEKVCNAQPCPVPMSTSAPSTTASPTTAAAPLPTATSEADSNHQEQAFGTCGHSLSQAQCDTFAQAALSNADPAGVVTEATKPIGCYKDAGANTYHFNNEPTAYQVPCDTTNVCICDKLVGAFDTSTIVCNSLGFDPTFTYNPAGETQDVTVDIKIGSGATGSTNPDIQCSSSKTTTDSSTITVTAKGDFDGTFTSQIPFGSVAEPKCGGTLTQFVDATDSKNKIRYLVSAEATVTRKFRSTVQRKRKFTFQLECLMERDVTTTSDRGFTVAAALITANEEELATSDFHFAATLKFYDSGYTTAETSALAPKNNEKVYAQIEKGANQDLFVYSVEKCYATIGSDPLVATAGHKDVFFTSQCPTDETMDFAVDPSTKNFRFEIQAFSFITNANAVFLHCDIKVCLADSGTLAGDCTQKPQSTCTTAVTNNRRRRDVSYKSLSNGGYREETVSSSQPILLEGSQFHAPQCGEGFVYDRVAKECSRSNLIEVNGIRLASDVFKADFFNTSSKAFKDMAREKEYLLWVLIKTTGQDKIIRGVQVVRARPGSVILDVAVKHADTVTPKQAFTILKQVLKAPPSTTRVLNVLQITQEKSIEYVPVVRQGEKTDFEKLILIVVIVVLFVVVFIAGVTLFKVKQVRQQPSNARPAVGLENKGIDA